MNEKYQRALLQSLLDHHLAPTIQPYTETPSREPEDKGERDDPDDCSLPLRPPEVGKRPE